MTGDAALVRPGHVVAPTIGRYRLEECLWVHHGDEAGYVPEAEAGEQSRLQRHRVTEPQGFASPDEVFELGHLVVHAVEAAVRRDDAVREHLAEADQLECCSTALRVPGQALLRYDEQRRSVGAADGLREAGVQFCLVRVVGCGRGVVLGDHGHVVGADAECVERQRE